MRSLKDWWAAARRPLSVRGHLYGIAFWLALGGLIVHQMLTDRSVWSEILILAGVLANLVYLLVSVRIALRDERSPSPEDDVQKGRPEPRSSRDVP